MGSSGRASYDSRSITIDPGLTLLALRGLRNQDDHYPFIERHTRWRGIPAAVRRRLVARLPTVPSLLAGRMTTG